MHYFCGSIGGASDAYFRMKEKIAFSDKDELYILGDVLDGNDENPEACISILVDVIAHDNIHLLLGDHEYIHIMNVLDDDPTWQMEIERNHQEAFAEYFGNLPEDQRAYYLKFLLECELTDLVKIGDHYFYLVHSSPVMLVHGDVTDWQMSVTQEEIDVRKDYTQEIFSDPNMKDFLKKYPDYDGSKTIVITNQTETKEIFLENDELYMNAYQDEEKHLQKCVFQNKKIFLNTGCSGNMLGQEEDGFYPCLTVIGVDAAGFFVCRVE